MVHFDCIECGKSLKADEGSVGKRVRCNHCGRVQEIRDQPARPQSDPQPARHWGQATAVAVSTDAPEEHGREPWFYRYVESTAGIMISINMAIFAIALALIVGIVAMYVYGEEPKFNVPFALAFLFGVLVESGWTIFLLCFALLFIDIGRSLRAIQHNTEPTP